MNVKNIARQVWRAAARTFGVRREERVVAAIVLLLLVGLNTLVIAHYYGQFSQQVRFYWPHFIHNFHISGFDPITYSVVSDWTAGYNVYRHPLLAFYMYVPYLVNQALMWLTGINCAMFVVAAIQMFSAFYAMLFFRRTLRELVGLDRVDASLLTLLLFSFAYVMLSAIVPDHFIISMMLLLLTLHIAGTHLKRHTPMPVWQTLTLFFLTAGVSLNNGLKTFMASLFANGRRFFRPKHLLVAVILPSALIWGVGRWSYDNIVWPRDMARNAAKAKQKAAKEKKERERKLAQWRADSTRLAHGDTSVARADTAKTATAKPKKKTTKRAKQGRPISNGEFMRWTDITTSRTQSVVENLFGESIQLHDKHLLEDEYRNRPMIVHYSWAINYVVEALLVALMAVGVWCGRRSRLLWLALSWFAMDMALHVGLGFGINEVYIMSAHWIFVMPLAMAYAALKVPQRHRRWMRTGMSLLLAYLLIYNITLIATYLA